MNDYKNLESYINEIRSYGRYSFSWEELTQHFDLSENAISQSLYRLKSKNKIAKIRRGFYAIITPEYSKQKMIPPSLFIDDLMKYLGKDYYIALFSAAVIHGASHQALMEYYVMTKKPALRNIQNNKLKINFYVKKAWFDGDIIQRKTSAGYINVSSPELTALDLLAYGNYGINRIFTILEELTKEMKASNLLRIIKDYPQTTTSQRLGYLLDKELGNKQLTTAVKKGLKNRTLYPVRLSINSRKIGPTDENWKIIKNTKVESDL